jgi:hypothetical protein
MGVSYRFQPPARQKRRRPCDGLVTLRSSRVEVGRESSLVPEVHVERTLDRLSLIVVLLISRPYL